MTSRDCMHGVYALQQPLVETSQVHRETIVKTAWWDCRDHAVETGGTAETMQWRLVDCRDHEWKPVCRAAYMYMS